MKHPILVKDPRSTVFSRALRTGPVSFFFPDRLKKCVQIVAKDPIMKQISKEYTTVGIFLGSVSHSSSNVPVQISCGVLKSSITYIGK